MELRQIRYFLAAAESLNFTRAAERCNVSVPSLTRAIRLLEDELGGDLFRRERHLTHLTDLGRLMQQHLSVAFNATELAQLEAERQKNADTRLKMGVFSTMPSRHLVSYLRALRASGPDIRLDIWEANCEELSDALLRGEIDIGILSLPEYSDRFRPIPLFRERFFISFPKGHRFEAMEAVPLHEFEGEPYIRRMHCEFPSNLSHLKIAKPYHAVDTRYRGEREDWIQSMVSAGLGMAVMPEFLPIIDGLETRLITEPEVHRQISMVTVAGRTHTRPVAVALRTAQTLNWEQSPQTETSHVAAK